MATSVLNLRIFYGTRQLFPAGTRALATVIDGNQKHIVRQDCNSGQVTLAGLPFYDNNGDKYSVIAYVDDRNRRGIPHVLLVEFTTCQNRDSHGLEEAGTDDVPVKEFHFLLLHTIQSERTFFARTACTDPRPDLPEPKNLTHGRANRSLIGLKSADTKSRQSDQELGMAKGKNITLHRKDTKVRRVQVRNRRIAIMLYLDKSDALRLAKEIEKRWGRK